MNKEQLAIIGLSAALVFDTLVHFRNRKKFNDLLKTANELHKVAVTNDRQNDYFRHLLDEHDIPISEFDVIVMKYLHED